MQLLDHALKFASRGWLVFPIRPGQKTPATKNGFKDASVDPAQIEKWWSGRKDWNDRNIGCVTSAESGIWVLDCDVDSETGEFLGDATLEALEAEHGKLPPHPISRTPKGGHHHIFAWPADGDIPRRIKFRPGLDALGAKDGKAGYFILPPSTRADGAYEWVFTPDEVTPPPAPQWLVDMVRAEAPERPADLPRFAPTITDRTTPYGRKTLLEECANIENAAPGSQDVVFIAKATRIGSLAHGGEIEIGEGFSAVVEAGLRMRLGDPSDPWTRDQLEKKAKRCFDHAAKDPSRAPNKPMPERSRAPEPEPEYADDGLPVYDSHDEYDEPDDQEQKPKPLAETPFRVLGYNGDSYYYLPYAKGQVVSLRASEHKALQLMQLATIGYWEVMFGDGKPMTRAAWDAAANSLISTAHAEGIFEETRKRGRGAWIDKGRVIVHTGGEARIGDETLAVHHVRSNYVYEAMPQWEFGYGRPASSKEAHKLVEICDRLTWENRLSAALLAGWCVIAPVSGALKWRPHIWITGSSGSGKSTALEEIAGRIVGPASERFDGKATEAAIRQLMGYDARPIIFDEAESEDLTGAIRLQNIIDLARVASSGGRVPKGGADGKAKIYMVRSCFCFSSINTAVKHRADESRISKLILLPNTRFDREKHYADLIRDINEWFTPEFASSMFTRTVKYLPTLLKNAEIFTSAAAIAFKSRRAADQLGGMLAGYYLCHSDSEITFDKAAEFIARHDWNDHLSLDGETDEMQLFRFLMSRNIRIEGQQGPQMMTIGQAISATRLQPDDKIAHALGPVGIKSDFQYIYVANKSDRISEFMRDHTKWAGDWKRPLSMIPGAVKSDTTEYFAPGLKQRAVLVPIEHLDGTYVEREPGEEG